MVSISNDNFQSAAPAFPVTSDGLDSDALVPSSQSALQQVAFVDRRVDNIDDLVAALPNASVYFIDGTQDGISYISETLAQYAPEDVESVHLFTHGQAGALQIGDETLSVDNLTGYADELAAWGQSTTGDILLYGCDVADGEIGRSFIEQLALFTGGDIQASDDLTGSAALGGDWDLESTVGSIESALAISESGQLTYEGTLSTRTITSNGGGPTATIFVQEGTRTVTDVESTSDNRFEEKRGVFYSFDGGADTSLFRLNRYTGELRFRGVPDFEKPKDADGDNVYLVDVLVTDRDDASDRQALSIVVDDVAEGGDSGSAPVITSNGGSSYVFKNVEEGTSFVLDIEATDADGDTENKGISYRINAGDDADLFRVNRRGAVFFRDRPDFENPNDSNGDNLYRLNVLATDSTGKSDSQALEFRVNNRAGDEPIGVSMAEGESVVASLPLTDPVGRPIDRHTLTGPDSSLFEVVGNELQFKSAPDFDSPADRGGNNEYNFTLTAINNKNIAIVQEVTVAVEQRQTAELTITSDGGGNNAALTVDENTTFVTDVNATGGNGDSEGNGFAYSLNAGQDRNLFDIDADTGVISFKSAPDFENPQDADGNNVYFVNVLLRDSNGQSDSQFISVQVKNVSETGSAPVITNGAGRTKVIEGSTLAIDVNATDADGDTEGSGITYRINAGEDANRFDIDADTGEIFFKTEPDFENPGDDDGNNIYRVNVLATDSTGLVDSQFIQIEVTNKVSVYLLGGQSNMAGVGSNIADLTGAQANPFPDVQIWQDGVNDFVDLKPGFRSNFGNSNGFGAEIGFGFALEAARQNGTADTEEIYLVKYALGSTDLAVDWNPNGNNNTYSDFRDWTGSALASLDSASIGYDIEGMLWMQGENDAFSPSQAENYETNLTNFIADIRTRYGQGVDFLIGRLHDELPNGFTEDEEVREAQEDVADADSRNYLIDTDDFPVSGDRVHFTSDGHLALGEAFADVFIS